MKRKKIKIGIIGLGIFFKKRHWPALAALSNQYQIKAIYSSSKQKFQEFTQDLPGIHHARDIKELLSQDIDLVICCLPIAKMHSIGSQVIRAGKHLVLSKPLTANAKQAKSLVHLAQKHRVKLYVTENFRFMPSLHKLKSLLDKDFLGSVKMVRINSINLFDLSSPYALKGKGWRIQPKGYFGILLDGGIHIISTMRMLFSNFRLKYRYLKSFNPCLGKYDTAFFHLKMDHNESSDKQAKSRPSFDAFITISYSMKKKGYTFLNVFCEEGIYHLSRQELVVEKNFKHYKTYKFSDDEYIIIYKEIYADLKGQARISYSAKDAYEDMVLFERLFKK